MPWGGPGTAYGALTIHHHQGVTLCPQTREVHVNDVELRLTRTEFDLLALLIASPSTIIRREELLEGVWGYWPGDDHIIETHLSRLRSKIVKAGGPVIGEAIRGVGYRCARHDTWAQPA